MHCTDEQFTASQFSHHEEHHERLHAAESSHLEVEQYTIHWLTTQHGCLECSVINPAGLF